MKAVVALLCLVGVVSSFPENFNLPELENGGVHWAVLVAGSKGWMNYRHQADVCHAYQVLKKHGLPDERIVVIMEDDIAYDKSNPEKGVIINEPGGENVYKGVPKDYTGKDVTPDVFLDVLQGKKSIFKRGSGKVVKSVVPPALAPFRGGGIEYLNDLDIYAGGGLMPLAGSPISDSGANDNIFVNFVDHGAPGLVAFGEKFLHAKELNKVLKKMHSEGKYNKMLIYVESCESGSMFKNTLPKDINILAVTASNATQSSYACYFDKKRKTYLGDVFSVKWMQDSDNENLKSESIEKQFSIVRKETNTSHVMQYGDRRIGDLMLSSFQGSAEINSVPQVYPDANNDAVPSEDVEIHVQKQIVLMADSTDQEKAEARARISSYKMKRLRIDSILKRIVGDVSSHHTEVLKLMLGENEVKRLDCYQPVVEYLKDNCAELGLPRNGYALKQLRIMVNLCERPYSFDSIKEAIDKVCV